MKKNSPQTLRARWTSPNGAYGYELHQPRDGVILSCPWGSASVSDIEAYVVTICELMKRQETGRCVLILDYGALEKTNSDARRIFVQALETMDPPLAGLVFVRLKPIMRVFIRLGRRLANIPFPVAIEATRERGIKTAIELLEQLHDSTGPLPRRSAKVRHFLPKFLLRTVARELREELAEFPWDSAVKEPYPVPEGHPFHEIFEMWGTVKDDLDRMDAARQHHMAELGAAVRALRESEHRYRAVFEASGAAMVIYGPDRIVRLANDAALRLSGLQRSEIESGFDWTTMVHPEDLDRLLDYHERRLVDPTIPSRYECRFRNSKNRELVGSVTVEAVPGTNLRVASLDDLTETRLAEAEIVRLARNLEQRVLERTSELEATNLRLAEALRSREEFLASMSHELRTPLASILNLSESLETGVYGVVTERQSKALTTIGSNGQHLLDLITDILDLSKSQAGKLELRPCRMSLTKAVRDAVAMIMPAAAERGLSLETQLDAEHDEIHADPLRVKQMIVNLLSNAVKFTPRRGRLGVRTRLASTPDRCVIEVWDQGIGISQHDQERLFQPFVQLDNRLSREHAGTGLGLSLTRSLVIAHRGTIRLASDPGEGSRFEIELPRGDLAPSKEVTASPKAVPVAKRSSARILVIEDNADLRGVLADYLEAVGERALVAESGVEGLRILESHPVDVVLLDVQMPGMDGYEVMRRIRGNPATRDLPVIAMTGLAFEDDARRCREAGANVHVPKPLRMSELTRLIHSLRSESDVPAR